MRLEFKCMKSKKYNNAFGIVLARLRKEKKWSQEYLSFEADLTRTYISLLERGMRSPTLDSMMLICNALGITLSKVSNLIEIEIDMREHVEK